MEKSFPYKPYYYYVDVAGKIKGILPLFFINSWLSGKLLISVPFGVYGGILADNQKISKKLHEKALSIARELEVDFLELRYEDKNVQIHSPKHCLPGGGWNISGTRKIDIPNTALFSKVIKANDFNLTIILANPE